MPKWAAVILAAGKGTRMKSKLPKVMHRLAGKPLIDHVFDTVQQIGIEKTILVLGHGREQVESYFGGRAQIVVQSEQLGTGHAVMQALPELEGVENVLVLSGDQPLFRAETLTRLLNVHVREDAVATVLTAQFQNPYGYGRIVRSKGVFEKIVEEKDALPEERLISEINTGTYGFKVTGLRKALGELTPQNAQGEYYLTGVFDIFRREGGKILTALAEDPGEALGINSRAQLAEAERVLRQRILNYWMAEGVTIVDPATTYIDAEVELSRDVILLPFTILQGLTTIGEDSVIGPHVLLENCRCGKGTEVTHTVARQAVMGDECKVGPFAYLRPGTELDKNVKVGDFVEVKNSKVGQGSKIPHLSYIGDADIGKSVNIGAGTITCNYDGVKKHATVIGDYSFVGSNSNLVAPLTVGEGAYIGAGSTITKDVPAKALAVERSRQVIKEDWRE